MCGIVGIVANKNIVDDVFKSLQRLEYRGYDSAGIAVSHGGDVGLDRRRAEGKLDNLARELAAVEGVGTNERAAELRVEAGVAMETYRETRVAQIVERAEGPYVFDVEGTRYHDLVQSYGAIIVGHAHPAITAAISAAAAGGTSYGAPTPGELLLAQELAEISRFAAKREQNVTGCISHPHKTRYYL
jgi:glucosamine 6-phosphate synthetase-like amidotransferase/phosphosugar isomerase protein